MTGGKPINNGEYMFGSTMWALLGQFVCNTGQEITHLAILTRIHWRDSPLVYRRLMNKAIAMLGPVL